MGPRQCTVCGREYIPTAYNQTRCADCTRARLMRCAVCGETYTGSRYNRPGNRSRCPACLARFRGVINTRAAHVQSDNARAGAFLAKSAAGRKNIKKAHAALAAGAGTAANSPTHAHAKIWGLIDPRGNTVETRNLRAFVRQHPESFPNASAAIKSFYTISQTMRHPETVRTPQYSCHGWRLAALPTIPDDVAERRAYRELKERKRRGKMTEQENE